MLGSLWPHKVDYGKGGGRAVSTGKEAMPGHGASYPRSAGWSSAPAVGEAKQTERWPASNLANPSWRKEPPWPTSDQKQEDRPARSSCPEARHESGKLSVTRGQEFVTPLQAHRLGPALMHSNRLQAGLDEDLRDKYPRFEDGDRPQMERDGDSSLVCPIGQKLA